MLKWPDKEAVDFAMRRWAKCMAGSRKDVLQIGYFGSYARGDWGVGSDLDLIVDEWQKVRSQGRFGRTVMKEAVWVYRG